MTKKIRRKGFPDSVPEKTPWNDKDGEQFEHVFLCLLDAKFTELNSVPRIMNYLKEYNLLEGDGEGDTLRIDLLSERFERTFGEPNEITDTETMPKPQRN